MTRRLLSAAVAFGLLAVPLAACGGGAATKSTATTQTEPRPTTTDDPSVVKGVTAGAFCSPEGAKGRTSTGMAMVCSNTSSDSRARWRAP